MKQRFVSLLGKGVQKASKLRGGGSALPGLIVERVDPHFMKRTLGQLTYGVVLISGTNGKTTTTKMVVELLQAQGLRVFTNRTGSNFTRGIVAALIESVDKKGMLNFDIAVLELDEAYSVKFVTQIAPDYSLFLNVLRDQLDRFGEIDATAEMLRKVAVKTVKAAVINRDDPRLYAQSFIGQIKARIATYGVSPKLAPLFPSDDTMRSSDISKDVKQPTSYPDDTCLEELQGQTASIQYGGSRHTVTLQLKGSYNVLNATAAVALVRCILGKDLNEPAMVHTLSTVTPAFGRGEAIMVNGQPVELVLVKNPSGFRLSLASFNPENVATMIAINDNYADGRDMSWLWDVNFESLTEGVAQIGGVRAYDMALRLSYDEVPCKDIEPDISRALRNFLATYPDQPKRIFCTYTAMLSIRKGLSRVANVEKVL